MSTTTCRKCNGTGTLVAFFHVEFGKCFACNGKGTRDFAAERDAKNRHARNLAAAYALPNQEQVRDALMAANPTIRLVRADHLATSWVSVAVAEIWGEERLTDTTEEAAVADRILSGVSS